MSSALMQWPSKLAVLCDGSIDDGAARIKERTKAELVMMAVMGRPWRRPHEHGHGLLGRLCCWVCGDALSVSVSGKRLTTIHLWHQYLTLRPTSSQKLS